MAPCTRCPACPDCMSCECNKKKLASLMPDQHLKHYNAVHAYIFDYDEHEPQLGIDTAQERAHKLACSKMHSFFQQSVNCQVHTVAHNSIGVHGPKGFLNWWKEELSKYGKDVLVIVYFQGRAAGRGITYEWRFFSKPHRISAHKLFLATNNREPDCLWMLDCHFPTRYRDIPHRVRGASDYTIAGQNLDFSQADIDNNQAEWDYTTRIATFLPKWVKELNTTYSGHHKRLSVPEIMGSDIGLCSNPLRLWERKTSRGSTRNVYRMCVQPDEVRATGLIQFVRVRIQGLHKTDKDGVLKANDNSDSEDDFWFEDTADEMLSEAESDKAMPEHEHEQASQPGNDGDDHFTSESGGKTVEPELKREAIDPNAGSNYINLANDEHIFVDPTPDIIRDIKMEHFGNEAGGDSLFFQE